MICICQSPGGADLYHYNNSSPDTLFHRTLAIVLTKIVSVKHMDNAHAYSPHFGSNQV